MTDATRELHDRVSKLEEEQRLHALSLYAHSELLSNLEQQAARTDEIARLAFDTMKQHSAKLDRLEQWQAEVRQAVASFEQHLPHPSPIDNLATDVAGLRAENERLKRNMETHKALEVKRVELIERISQRAADAENALAAVTSERDALKAALNEAESEMPHDFTSSLGARTRRLAEVYWAVVRYSADNDRGALLNVLDKAKEQAK